MAKAVGSVQFEDRNISFHHAPQDNNNLKIPMEPN